MPTPTAALQAEYLSNFFAALARTAGSQDLQATFATLQAQCGGAAAADVAAACATLATLVSQSDQHTDYLQADIEFAQAKANELKASIAAGI